MFTSCIARILRKRTIILLVKAQLLGLLSQASRNFGLVHGDGTASRVFEALQDILLEEVVEEAIRAHNDNIFVLDLMEVDFGVVRQLVAGPALVRMIELVLTFLGAEDCLVGVLLRSPPHQHIAGVAQVKYSHMRVTLIQQSHDKGACADCLTLANLADQKLPQVHFIALFL